MDISNLHNNLEELKSADLDTLGLTIAQREFLQHCKRQVVNDKSEITIVDNKNVDNIHLDKKGNLRFTYNGTNFKLNMK